MKVTMTFRSRSVRWRKGALWLKGPREKDLLAIAEGPRVCAPAWARAREWPAPLLALVV